MKRIGKALCKMGFTLIELLMVIAIAVTLLPTLSQAGEKARFLDSTTENYFTIVVLPDTQFYSEKYPEIFESQTRWIVENISCKNIVFVIHLGDIVEHYNSREEEWKNANRAMSILDGKVPYSVLPGNHDGAPDNTVLYNKYFPYTRYQNKEWYGGHYDINNDNNYQLISAGGQDFIILNLEYFPNESVRKWANDILKKYSERQAIVVTHAYLHPEGKLYDPIGSRPWEIYNDVIIPNKNVFLVLCGHLIEDKRVTTIEGGRVVHQLMIDYQNRNFGGEGWLKILKFVPSKKKIHVMQYSPYLDKYERDSDSEYTLEWKPKN